MTGEANTKLSWWGDSKLDHDQSRQWRIGPLSLLIRHLNGEWQIAYERLGNYDNQTTSVEVSESSLDMQFSVWARRENFLELKNSVQEEIKDAFDEHGIEIPFPHRNLYTGSKTEPFPIETVINSKSTINEG